MIMYDFNKGNKQAYDFVIITEVKHREFESCCLLCYELKRRGYKVKLLSTWDEAFYKHRRIPAKVVVSWSMYNTRTFNHISSFVCNCKKMINMQWEQMLMNSALENTSENILAGVHGKAREVVHITWGENTKNRLINSYHVPKKKVFVTGDITLDFYRDEFRSLVFDRERLLNKYSLPKNKKVILFISTFAMIEYPEQGFQEQNLTENDRRFQTASVDSQKRILEWFATILSNNNDSIIIYRPHPAERSSKILLDYEKKIPNFYVIADEVIRQWIIIADKIYTWMSTSIKEVYMAGKSCYILRPFKIDREEEAVIYNNAAHITSYEEFEDSFVHDHSNLYFPISKEIMQEFIYIPTTPTYKSISDCFEEVLHSSEYNIDFEYKHEIRREIKRNLNNFSIILFAILSFIRGKTRIPFLPSISKKLDYYEYCVEMRKKNHFTKEELKDQIEKFNFIIKE